MKKDTNFGTLNKLLTRRARDQYLFLWVMAAMRHNSAITLNAAIFDFCHFWELEEWPVEHAKQTFYRMLAEFRDSQHQLKTQLNYGT